MCVSKPLLGSRPGTCSAVFSTVKLEKRQLNMSCGNQTRSRVSHVHPAPYADKKKTRHFPTLYNADFLPAYSPPDAPLAGTAAICAGWHARLCHRDLWRADRASRKMTCRVFFTPVIKSARGDDRTGLNEENPSSRGLVLQAERFPLF